MVTESPGQQGRERKVLCPEATDKEQGEKELTAIKRVLLLGVLASRLVL